MSDKSRDSGKDITLDSDNDEPHSILVERRYDVGRGQIRHKSVRLPDV